MNFYASYSRFCAVYSAEVIVFFLTAFVGSVTLNLKNSIGICYWTLNCTNDDLSTDSNIANSNAVLLSILRCSTIIYFFIKFKSISKLGTPHIIYAVLFCVAVSSIIFMVIVSTLQGKDYNVVGGSLPIFLLLIDLSRIVAIVKHTLPSISVNDIQTRISEAMKILGPVYTLDTVLEILVIFSSSCVNIRQLNEISCFAILSLLINFMIFTTFVPACLSTYFSVTRHKIFGHQEGLPIWHKKDFFHSLASNKEGDNKFFIKVIICTALFFVNIIRETMYPKLVLEGLQETFDSVLSFNPQQMLTLTILMILGMKLVLKYDKIKTENSSTKLELNNYPHKHSHTYTGKVLKEALHADKHNNTVRDLPTCVNILNAKQTDILSDDEVILLVKERKIPSHALERVLQDANRGVEIRRKLVSASLPTLLQKSGLQQIPHASYNFTTATLSCCENTVGYIPVPIGIVGPLLMNGKQYQVPLATTEGTLLASTNRGMKAIYQSGGVQSCVYDDGMTRSPVVKFPNIKRCCEAAKWLKNEKNFGIIRKKFEGTSRFAKLQEIKTCVSGVLLFIRFKATTGDAMGMNMVSKASEEAIKKLHEVFDDMEVISLSGNYCSDKKPSSVNWVLGRGKSVVAEAIIKSEVVRNVLKIDDIETLVKIGFYKNQVGSAMSGTIGGFNAHAANIVTALFIATGQDPAQNVESSNCITMIEKVNENTNNEALKITCTMPSVEVGTVGGGTNLDPQRACLKILGVLRESGISDEDPGEKSSLLAQIVCASVLAGELSLLSALAAGHLVKSHMKHNRLHSNVCQTKNEHNIL